MLLRIFMVFFLLAGGSYAFAIPQVPPQEMELSGDHGDPFGSGDNKANCTGPTSYTDPETKQKRWMYSHPTMGSTNGFISSAACRKAMTAAGCR